MEVKVKLELADLLPESLALGLAVMQSQREKGVEKYGQPIEDAKLTAGELVVHAQQEMADGLVYTSMLGKRVVELEEELAAVNRTLQTVRNEYARACETGDLRPVRDALQGIVPAPSKREVELVKALLEIVGQCKTRTLGYPGEQVGNIHSIALRALK